MDSLVYPQKYIISRITIFSLCKRRTDSLKVIASAEVQFSTQNQVKSKKKGHRVRRSPNFHLFFFFALPMGAAGPNLGPNH